MGGGRYSKFPRPLLSSLQRQGEWSYIQLGEAFGSLGASLYGAAEGKAKLQNAANDTFAQVVAFLRFMTMTEEEWTKGRGRPFYGQFPDGLDQIDLLWISEWYWKKNQEMRPILAPGKELKEVEEVEPVVVHQSIKDEIDFGLTAIDVDAAPMLGTWAAVLRTRPESVPDITSTWSPSASWPSNTWTSATRGSPDWEWNSTTTLASACNLQEHVEELPAKTPTKPSTPTCSTSKAVSTGSP